MVFSAGVQRFYRSGVAVRVTIATACPVNAPLRHTWLARVVLRDIPAATSPCDKLACGFPATGQR